MGFDNQLNPSVLKNSGELKIYFSNYFPFICIRIQI